MYHLYNRARTWNLINQLNGETVLVVLHGSKIIPILKNILISIKQKWYAYMYFYIAVDE